MGVLLSTPREQPLPPADETHRIVRERLFAPSQLEHVLLLVHEERLTGVVSLDISQGALCSIRVNEQQKLKPR